VEFVEEYRIVEGHVLAILGNANSAVNRINFITLATDPYMLLFVHVELRDTRETFTCWKFHINNGQGKSLFRYSISHLIASNDNMLTPAALFLLQKIQTRKQF